MGAAAVTFKRRVWEIVETAAANDVASRRFDIAISTLIALNILALTLESVEAIGTRWAGWFFAFELFSVAVFTAEYVARLWSCVEADDASGSGHLGFRCRYALRPIVLIDLLAVLPFYLGVLFHLDLRFLRALRLLRVLKLTRYSPAVALLFRTLRQERESLSAAMFFLLIVLVITASGIYMFENRAQPEAFGSIPAAVWWAITTLTTVGYGDVTPLTPGGKAFGVLVMIVGIGMVALPTAILASAFSEQLSRRREEYQVQVDDALADGVITDDEAAKLETIRRQLGMGEEEAERILKHELRAWLEDKQPCPHCGRAANEPHAPAPVSAVG